MRQIKEIQQFLFDNGYKVEIHYTEPDLNDRKVRETLETENEYIPVFVIVDKYLYNEVGDLLHSHRSLLEKGCETPSRREMTEHTVDHFRAYAEYLTTKDETRRLALTRYIDRIGAF